MSLRFSNSVLRRMLALAVAAAAPLSAQEPTTRHPLTAETVAATLAPLGLFVEAAQLELPAALTTVSAHPELRVAAAELLPEARLRVRITCAQAGDCQPFLVTVRQLSPAAGLAALTSLDRTLLPAASFPAHNTAARLQAGQHATLLLEDAHMRISVPVIVIDSGEPGTEVRASSLDRKQLYRAVVADAGTLRGSLP